MLEASGSAGKVTVSPVRTAGMSPYLARIIEILSGTAQAGCAAGHVDGFRTAWNS